MKNISLLFLILFAGISANIHSVQAQVPNVKICMISDPHVFDSTLLVSNGLAIQTYLAYDRELLLEGWAILTSVLDSAGNKHREVMDCILWK